MLKLQNLILDALLENAVSQETNNPSLSEGNGRLHDLEKGLAKAYLTLAVLESSFRDDSLAKLKIEIALLLNNPKHDHRNLTLQEKVELRHHELTSTVVNAIKCLRASKDSVSSKRLHLLRLNLEKLLKGGVMCSQ